MNRFGGRRPALLVGGLLIALTPSFASDFMLGLLTKAFLFAILAISVDLLWGYTGILTLGQSAFFGIGAYAVGLAFTDFKGAYAGAGFEPGWGDAALALLLAVAVAAAVGAAVGWFAFWHKASPLYIGVITLALSVVFTQLVNSGGTFTGSSTGLTGFPGLDVGQDQWFRLAAATLVVVGVAAYVFVGSDAGRVLVAIRENEERCRYLGLDTSRIKTLLFCACGCIAALAGVLYALYTSVVAPPLGDFVLATEAVIWVALGGRGTLIGPIAGAISINVLEPVLGGQFPFVWLLFVGVLFVVVVTLAPQGLFPLLGQAGGYARRRSTRRLKGATNRRAAPARSGVTVELRRKQAEVASSVEKGGGGSAERKLAVEAIDVRKHFGSLEVLKGVSLTVQQGELLSVVGPNGAGKTTLIRCIADGRERTSGTIRVNGEAIDQSPPHRVVGLGVGRKFQAANVFESITVAESLQIASRAGRFPPLWRRTRRLELPEPALHALEATGLVSMLDTPVRDLGHGSKQALELAMVLALEPTVLLLDEPTAGLSQEERTAVGRLLIELSRRGDMCVVLVEHDFEFVKSISTRMLVLHQGTVLLDGTVEEVAASDLVRSVYLGAAH